MIRPIVRRAQRVLPLRGGGASAQVWMTMHRERACLAQRPDSGPRLTGKVKRTIRNMLTELFTNSWPRLWPSYAELGRSERGAYESTVNAWADAMMVLFDEASYTPEEAARRA